MAGINRFINFDCGLEYDAIRFLIQDPTIQSAISYQYLVRSIQFRNNEIYESTLSIGPIRVMFTYYKYPEDTDFFSISTENDTRKDFRGPEFSDTFQVANFRESLAYPTYLDYNIVFASVINFHDSRTATKRYCMFKANSKHDSLKLIKRNMWESGYIWILGFTTESFEEANVIGKVTVELEF